MKKLTLLINPVAGHGLGPQIKNLIEVSGLKNSFEVNIKLTEFKGHAIQLARQEAENKTDVIVAVGGDGTVNEVASQIAGTASTLGIIPAGSGNGLARHIGMKLHPLKALQQLTNARIAAIDSLIINGKFAVNVSGFGFDGYVAWLFNQSKKRGLGTYAKIGMQEYFRYPVADFIITADGIEYRHSANMIVIANASQFGNAAIIAPRADLNDKLMDLVVVRRPPVYDLPRMFFRLFRGTLKDNLFLKTYSCSSFSATSSRPLHLHIDGEAMEPLSRIDARVLPGSLNILTPL